MEVTSVNISLFLLVRQAQALRSFRAKPSLGSNTKAQRTDIVEAHAQVGETSDRHLHTIPSLPCPIIWFSPGGLTHKAYAQKVSLVSHIVSLEVPLGPGRTSHTHKEVCEARMQSAKRLERELRPVRTGNVQSFEFFPKCPACHVHTILVEVQSWRRNLSKTDQKSPAHTLTATTKHPHKHLPLRKHTFNHKTLNRKQLTSNHASNHTSSYTTHAKSSSWPPHRAACAASRSSWSLPVPCRSILRASEHTHLRPRRAARSASRRSCRRPTSSWRWRALCGSKSRISSRSN